MSGGQRAVPFHCPFCGDENLWPHGETHGQWECRACQRAFAVKYLGLLNPAHTPTTDPSTSHSGTPSERRTAP